MSGIGGENRLGSDAQTRWSQITEVSEVIAVATSQPSSVWNETEQHELSESVDASWIRFNAIFEESDINLRGRARLDARTYFDQVLNFYRILCTELARNVLTGEEAPGHIRKSIADIDEAARTLLSLNTQARVNPYARIDGSARCIPGPDAIFDRPWLDSSS